MNCLSRTCLSLSLGISLLAFSDLQSFAQTDSDNQDAAQLRGPLAPTGSSSKTPPAAANVKDSAGAGVKDSAAANVKDSAGAGVKDSAGADAPDSAVKKEDSAGKDEYFAPGASESTQQFRSPSPLLPNDTVPLGPSDFAAKVDLSKLHGGISAQVLGIVDEISYEKPCKNCVGVKLRILNSNPVPVIVDGDRAFASGDKSRAMSEAEALKVSGGTFSKKEKQILAAVAVGSLGLAEPILQDHFSTSKKDFPVSYGVNETRRRLENQRLAKRIVLPGEDTEGVVFFRGDSSEFGKISIPVLSYPQELASGIIEISGIDKNIKVMPAETPATAAARAPLRDTPDDLPPPKAARPKRVKDSPSSAAFDKPGEPDKRRSKQNKQQNKQQNN